jgi:hypothetical protein
MCTISGVWLRRVCRSDHTAKPGTERVRRCRERQRAGRSIFHLELDEAQLQDFLIRIGFLSTISADFDNLVQESLHAWIVTCYSADSGDEP